MAAQIRTDRDKKELKEHGSYAFPVMVSEERLSDYGGAFLWHWHPEIELTIVLEGEILYQAGEKTWHLKPGQGLFCNSNALHTGRMAGSGDCRYISVTFDPKILYGYSASLLYTKYVHPVIRDTSVPAFLLELDGGWQQEILEHLGRIWTVYQEKSGTVEMEIQLALTEIWLGIYRHTVHRENANAVESTPDRSQERIRTILRFIQEHYEEKITLDQIAAQVNICKSECCRFFKKYMRVTMFDYLLAYRIDQSLPLLAGSDREITEVAGRCGFANPCYYTRVFKRLKGCTPMEFRKRSRKSESGREK